MAIAFVGGANSGGTAAGVTTDSVTYTPTTGHIVVVGVITAIAANGTFSNMVVKDSNNVPLLVGPSFQNTAVGTTTDTASLFYYTVPASAPTSFTATWVTTANASVMVAEYSGVTSVLNSSGNVNSGVSSPSTITVTTSAANDFVVALLSSLNALATISSGNTRESIGTGTCRGILGDNTAASIGSAVTVSATFTGAQGWSAAALELRTVAFPTTGSQAGPSPHAQSRGVVFWNR